MCPQQQESVYIYQREVSFRSEECERGRRQFTHKSHHAKHNLHGTLPIVSPKCQLAKPSQLILAQMSQHGTRSHGTLLMTFNLSAKTRSAISFFPERARASTVLSLGSSQRVSKSHEIVDHTPTSTTAPSKRVRYSPGSLKGALQNVSQRDEVQGHCSTSTTTLSVFSRALSLKIRSVNQ